MMNKLFFLFVIYFYSILAFAKENSLIIEGTKKIPIEINLALSGLQFDPLEEQDFLELKGQINRIEEYAQYLTEEEIFLIAKSIFYKAFLTLPKSGGKFYYDQVNLKNLSEAINNTNDPFLKWFFMALEKDALIITKLPYYNDFVAAHTLGKVEKIDLKKIDKKVQLVSWWITKINPTNPELILKDVTPLLKDILNKIEVDYYFLSTLTKPPLALEKKAITNHTFYTVVEGSKKTKALTPQKTINDIIDSVILPSINAPADLPKPTNEPDWLQDI